MFQYSHTKNLYQTCSGVGREPWGVEDWRSAGKVWLKEMSFQSVSGSGGRICQTDREGGKKRPVRAWGGRVL